MNKFKFDDFYTAILEEQAEEALAPFKDFKVLTQNVIAEELITEGIIDNLKEVASKVKNMFNVSTEWFTKGYDAVKTFCKKVFKLTYFTDFLKALGLTDNFLDKLTSVVKNCLIFYPIAKIGAGVYKGVKEDIKDHDIKILIDTKKFNDESAKLFSQKSFFSRLGFILKSGVKNTIAQGIIAAPLIMKCIFGYAVVNGFDEARKDIKENGHLSPHVKKALDRAENTAIQVANEAKSEEEALKIISDNYDHPGEDEDQLTNWIAKSELVLRRAKYENPETGKMENLNYFGSNEADKGKVLNNDDGGTWVGGSKTYRHFDRSTGKYVDTEVNNDAQEAARRLGNMPGMNAPGAPGVNFGGGAAVFAF